jgi:digeranylgeranylglycerophospholipid reductase
MVRGERRSKLGLRFGTKRRFKRPNVFRAGLRVGEIGTTRYLIGADGPRSRVAAVFGLGQSKHFLQGLEHEYADWKLDLPDRLHCFMDRKIAPGYLAWVLSGVGMVQVGFARRHNKRQMTTAQAMTQLLDKLAPILIFAIMRQPQYVPV